MSPLKLNIAKVNVRAVLGCNAATSLDRTVSRLLTAPLSLWLAVASSAHCKISMTHHVLCAKTEAADNQPVAISTHQGRKTEIDF